MDLPRTALRLSFLREVATADEPASGDDPPAFEDNFERSELSDR